MTLIVVSTASAAKRYLFVFIGVFVAALGVILALNLVLGERALGSLETLQKASA